MNYKKISWDKFSPKKLPKKLLPKKNPKMPQRTIVNDFCSLDTETSHINDEIAWVYQWSFSYTEDDENRLLVYGRKPSQLVHCLKKIIDVNDLDVNNKIIIFVHNLSYDYTYIHDFIEKEFGHKGELLAVGSHRIISYSIEGLEFRDSLKIAQKSLYQWCNDLNTVHKKLKGTVDYTTVRYQDSRLFKKDWKYMFYDVICLDEAISKQMSIWDDDISTIPLTNTGYVRREARKEFRKDLRKNRTRFQNKKLSLELYQFCKKEFAGGLTHGNRFYRNRTVKGMIRHRDFASHYPSQQICGYCPSGKFNVYYDNQKDGKLTIQDLWKVAQDRCILAAIVISNLHIKDGVTLPTAQYSKFYEGKLNKVDFVLDNGRILHQKEGASLVVVNEYDLKWLLKQYTFDYEIIKVYTATRGKFPKYLTDTVNRFFHEKSFYKRECKRIEKEFGKDSKEYREMNLRMMIAKGMLNAIFGMSATDPVRISFYEDEKDEWHKEILEQDDIIDKLDKFYSGKNNFMNYELGLWTTAQARNELLEFVELIGYENFIYADTDSIFYISTPEIEAKIEAINKKNREIDEENGWYTVVDDKKIYYNQFEDEKENITEFRFLHAKCYAYLVDGKELSVTVAGVKRYGKKGTREKELGCIENLYPGFVFTDCGGTIVKYPPKEYDCQPHMVDINGHMTEVAQYGIITASSKKLNSELENEETLTLWEVAENGAD